MAVAFAAQAQKDEAPQKERQPAQSAAATVTNAPKVASEPDELPVGVTRFQQIKDEIFKPFDSVKPGRALDGVLTVPRRTPPVNIPTKQEKEALEQKRNWIFMDVNEMYPGLQADDAKTGPDQNMGLKDGWGSSPVEKYFQRLDQKRAQTPNPWTGVMEAATMGKDGSTSNLMNMLGLMIPGNNPMMNMMFPGGMLTPGTDRNAARDASLAAEETAEQERKQERALQEFRRILDPSLPPLPAREQNSFSALDAILHPQQNPVGSSVNMSVPGAVRPGAMAPVLGIATPAASVFNPRAFENPSATGLDPVTRAQLMEPPKPAAPKSLDPFANMPKRKF